MNEGELTQEEFQGRDAQQKEDNEALESQYRDLARRYYMAKLLMEFRPIDFMTDGRMPLIFTTKNKSGPICRHQA